MEENITQVKLDEGFLDKIAQSEQIRARSFKNGPRIIGQFRVGPFMKCLFQCEQESWWYSCLKFYEFSAVDYIVFTIMLAVSASVGVSL